MRRIYHTWDEWECYPAGFYNEHPRPDVRHKYPDDEACYAAYAAFLRDLPLFRDGMEQVSELWPNSTEHYLTAVRMNRIAWLGQSAACVKLGLPARYRGGFNRLSKTEQHAANLEALAHLNRWLAGRGEPAVTLTQAGVKE